MTYLSYRDKKNALFVVIAGNGNAVLHECSASKDHLGFLDCSFGIHFIVRACTIERLSLGDSCTSQPFHRSTGFNVSFRRATALHINTAYGCSVSTSVLTEVDGMVVTMILIMFAFRTLVTSLSIHFHVACSSALYLFHRPRLRT